MCVYIRETTTFVESTIMKGYELFNSEDPDEMPQALLRQKQFLEKEIQHNLDIITWDP